MLSHNQSKYINSLKIKKFRQQHKTFIVEGEKGVSELLNSSLQPVTVFGLPDWIEKNQALLISKSVEFQEVNEIELKKVSDLITPNKVLAIAQIPELTLAASPDTKGMMIALDGIRDPGNMGTIIRTADWFGISKIVCSSDSVDIYNPKVVQATMGSFSRVQVFYTNLALFLKELPANYPVYGALLQGPALTEKQFTEQGIILIGSESHGISAELIPLVNQPVHIPRFSFSGDSNYAESLNASIANGIICYEICKQLLKNNF